MAEKNEELRLRNINDLLKEHFYIPSYQRGYRWNKEQVEALLKDIWEFEKKPLSNNNKSEPFYCLQPIVVRERDKPNNSQWEVIDGQQRLTTIFIILKHINLIEYPSRPKRIFEIEYQTRTTCNIFFENIEDKELANSNIDFFHIYQANNVINNWFTNKELENDSIRHDFRSKLLNQVKVIWYEADLDSNKNKETASIDIFTRLNIGKIPLTNAELIKALFLQKGNFEEGKASVMQLQIASEWDIIEKTLQNDAFWYFIYNPNNSLKYDNRIEFIFDLMQSKTIENEDRYTFIKFSNDFTLNKERNNGIANIDSLWLKIKKFFLSFEEWYNDKELYHLIGYLIEFGANLNTLKEESTKKNKEEFKEYLKEKIREKVNCQIDELSYGGKFIKEVLLLFNIQTILSTKNTDIRFPYNRFKDESWDIEHIRSQTDKTITKSNQREWTQDVLEYFTGITLYKAEQDITEQEIEISKLNSTKMYPQIKSEQELATRLLKQLIQKEINENDFNRLYLDITIFFRENEDFQDKDGIGNLALLDAYTNRSYGNAMFPIKRRTIISNDMKGVFVPICTKNVFLKSYTKKLQDNMYWMENDAKDYRNAIKTTLINYLPNQETNNEQ